MRKSQLTSLIFALLFISLSAVYSQRGYNTAPYSRLEADAGTLSNGATIVSSYQQADVAFEASDRKCVSMKSGGAVEWTVDKSFRGIVIRYSIDGVNNHTDNVTANIKLSVNGTEIKTLAVNTYYSWEMLNVNGNSNNNGITNSNWRMRFDEVRYLLPTSYPSGAKIKIERTSGNLFVDFIEIEDVASSISCPSGYAQYSGDGSNLQSFLDSNSGNVYIPAGTYNVPGSLNLGQNRTVQGAGMWYTNINFTSTTSNNGGVWSYFNNNLKNLSLTTSQNSRSNSYKGINGPWGNTSVVENVWVEHFECGAWIANYSSPYGNPQADGLTIRNCRFRNNYADGTNLCKGSKNCVIEYCSYRNNGDDDMAVWPANGEQCYNNTFRYNTAESCYRSASCALYGGYGNKWQNIIVKDNYEVGIRINGMFAGACFADGNQNEFSNIDVIGCGVWQNTYNNPEPAVDITTAGNCSNVKNIRLSCINIKNSKCDAIQLRKDGGDQISNLSLEGITIEKTSRFGVTTNSSWGSCAGIRFVNSPTVNNVQYCNLSFSNIEGENIVAYGVPTSGWTEKTSGCATCEIVAVTGVSFDQYTKTLAIGSSFTLAASIIPSTANNKSITWSTNNSSVAMVSTSGVVAGVKAGTATITATTVDGSKTAACVVTVQNVAVGSVTIPTTASMIVGDTYAIIPTITPDNATNKTVSYSILSGSGCINLNTATGLVTGVLKGTAVVQVTTQDGNKTANCTVTINPEPPCTGPIIVKTTTSPTIDGVADDVWKNAPATSITNRVINAGGDVTGFSAKWKAMYDNSNIYILVDVTKPTAYTNFFSYESTTTNWWQGSDAVELFFDGNNSKGASYDGIDDSHYIFVYNNSLITGGVANTANIQYKFTSNASLGNYTTEVSIPLSNLLITASEGKMIGFDVAVTISKEASATGRIAQYTTFSTTDQSYANASGFGSVNMKTCSLIYTDVNECLNPNEKSIVNYGNTIKVSGLISGEVISVYNILGSKIYTLTATQDTEYITSLKSGVYAVSIDGTRTAKKVLIAR